jgi:hypothetical protein
VIGYYGAIARWFDHGLLRNVAKRRRDLRFLLIGVEWDGTLSNSKLLREPNVTYLGPVAYGELPNYLSLFDVAVIPFVLNDLTHATSPLKLFEYMAGGKPVVVTPMRECVQYPGVLVGKTEEDFATKLDIALELAADRQYLALIDGVARQNTWETRAKLILDSLARKRPANNARYPDETILRHGGPCKEPSAETSTPRTRMSGLTDDDMVSPLCL